MKFNVFLFTNCLLAASADQLQGVGRSAVVDRGVSDSRGGATGRQKLDGMSFEGKSSKDSKEDILFSKDIFKRIKTDELVLMNEVSVRASGTAKTMARPEQPLQTDDSNYSIQGGLVSYMAQYMATQASFEYGIVLGRANLVRLAQPPPPSSPATATMRGAVATRLSAAIYVSMATTAGDTLVAQLHRGACATATALPFANPFLCSADENGGCTNEELKNAAARGVSPYFAVKLRRLDAVVQAARARASSKVYTPSSGEFEGSASFDVHIPDNLRHSLSLVVLDPQEPTVPMCCTDLHDDRELEGMVYSVDFDLHNILPDFKGAKAVLDELGRTTFSLSLGNLFPGAFYPAYIHSMPCAAGSGRAPPSRYTRDEKCMAFSSPLDGDEDEAGKAPSVQAENSTTTSSAECKSSSTSEVWLGVQAGVYTDTATRAETSATASATVDAIVRASAQSIVIYDCEGLDGKLDVSAAASQGTTTGDPGNTDQATNATKPQCAGGENFLMCIDLVNEGYIPMSTSTAGSFGNDDDRDSTTMMFETSTATGVAATTSDAISVDVPSISTPTPALATTTDDPESTATPHARESTSDMSEVSNTKPATSMSTTIPHDAPLTQPLPTMASTLPNNIAATTVPVPTAGITTATAASSQTTRQTIDLTTDGSSSGGVAGREGGGDGAGGGGVGSTGDGDSIGIHDVAWCGINHDDDLVQLVSADAVHCCMPTEAERTSLAILGKRGKKGKGDGHGHGYGKSSHKAILAATARQGKQLETLQFVLMAVAGTLALVVGAWAFKSTYRSKAAAAAASSYTPSKARHAAARGGADDDASSDPAVNGFGYAGNFGKISGSGSCDGGVGFDFEFKGEQRLQLGTQDYGGSNRARGDSEISAYTMPLQSKSVDSASGLLEHAQSIPSYS